MTPISCPAVPRASRGVQCVVWMAGWCHRNDLMTQRAGWLSSAATRALPVGTPSRWARPPGGHALPVGTPSRWARPPGGHALPVGTPSRWARPPGGHALPVGTPSRWARPPSGHALPVAADEQAEASYLVCIPTDRTARALRMLCVGAGRAPAVLPCPACLSPYNKKTLHIQGFLSHNPGSTWDSDENRYAAGRVPGIFESWDQTNAEIPCDAQRWLK